MRQVLALLACLPLLAAPAHANPVECAGTNAFSFAEVVEGRGALVKDHPEGRPRGGVVETVPDSLCPDIVDVRRRSIESLNIMLDQRVEGTSAKERPLRR